MNPTNGLVLIALTLAVAAWILLPLLRGGARRETFDDERLAEARTLESRQAMLVASLRDLEDDHAGDKIDREDYERLRDRLTRESIDVMRRLDRLRAEHEEALRIRTRTTPHPSSPTRNP